MPQHRATAVALLAALIVVAYAPTLAFDFVWDDHEQVVNNEVLHSWSNLPAIWSRDVLSLSRGEGQRSNYVRPLFFTLYLLLYQLFGTSALAWHAAAIAVHLGACLAAWLFLERLRLSPGVAGLATLLFAVHPVHGESVAWVAAAFNDPPAAAFSLLALTAHTRWLESGRWRFLGWGALAFAAALGFKESALALPALLLLTEHYLAPERPWRARLLGILPSLTVVALYLAARKAVLGEVLGVFSGPGWLDILPTLPRLGVEYLRFLAWPWGYSPAYPLRLVSRWSELAAWGSLSLLLGLTTWIWWTATRHRRLLGFAALWALLCVAPAFNIRSFRPTYLVHQRYLYLAVLGLAAALACWLVERFAGRARAAAVAALLTLFVASNLYHNRFWASDVALWQRVAAVDPGNPAAFDWLGARAMDAGHLDEARGLFERSIAADPAAPLGYRNLAVLLHTRRKQPALARPFYEEALARFAMVSRTDAEAAEARINYGVCLAELGEAEAALSIFTATAQAPYRAAAAARNAAVLLVRRGNREGAGRILLEAAADHPEDATLAAMLRDLGLAPSPTTGELFRERAAELGLNFVHFNGRSGERYMVEVLGAGAALFDYDGDGDLDAFLVQGAMLGNGKGLDRALVQPAPGMLPLGDRLYRNDLVALPSGRLEPRFVDVTGAAGLAPSVGYGMGVATGDVDNDGFVDLYVTRFGANQLWRNRGNGSFEDATARAGVGDGRFSSSATFLDYDRDGFLDLFVGHYVDFTYQNHRTCYGPSGAVDYCGPASYAPVPDRLLHNRGDGTFEDVSQQAGLGAAFGPALGVLAADFDGDGFQDLLVANDGAPNQLWINGGDGTFRDEALLAGCAVNGAGATEAGMGIDAADFDADGDEDLFITHLVGETNTLWINQGGGTFADATRTTGVGAPSFPHTGFGTRFFDLDNDGWLDLFVANGAIKDIPALVEGKDPYPLHEENQLFRNRGDGTYEEISSRGGAALALAEVSRGAAFGDLDLDGDTDILVTNNSGPVRYLENQVGGAAPWLGITAQGGRSHRPLTGSLVELELEGGRTLRRRLHTDGSYLSAHDPRVLVGLPGKPAALTLASPRGGRLRCRGLLPRTALNFTLAAE